MFAAAALTLLAACVAPALAHMEMQYPAPFLSKFNPNTLPSNIDWSMTNPLHADGSDYPCKGYNHVLGTPEGAVTATFAQGGAYNFTIVGTAFHGGGSCQASLSYDGGRTFTVIQSIIGNCPVFGSGNFDFTVPSDAPAGNAVFAWTWFNNIGNREMYQNCAAVTITGGGHRKRRLDVEQPAKRDYGYDQFANLQDVYEPVAKRFTPFSARPANFIANVGNGCSTEPNKDVMFPDPGPDVLINSNNVADVVGVCKPIGGAPTSSATPTSSSTTSSAEPTTTTAEPTTTHEPTTTPEPTTTQQPSTTPEPSSSTSSSSELHSSSTEAPPSSSSSVAPTSSSQAEPSSVSTSSTTHTEPTSTSAPSEAPSTTPSTTPSPTSTSDSSTSPSAPTHSGSSSASSSSSIHTTATPTSTTPPTTSSPCAEATILRRGIAGPGKFLVRRRRAASD